MRFSIVTPSFRQSEWLRLCVASVADQGVGHEHIVQDAGSDDGTLEWLRADPRVRAFVEKDQGMYDALNRGLRRSKGELLAYLNCDEQYLPGTLRAVSDWFDAHPEADMVFGDVVFVDERGEYVGYRKMQTPLLYHTWTCHLSTLTCGTFFRRSILDHGYCFDPSWKSGGDGEWMVRLLRVGVPMGTLGRFTSVFSQTGANLGTGRTGQYEALRLRASAPAWSRVLRPLLIVGHRLRRLAGGMYSGGPSGVEIYTRDSLGERKKIVVR